MSLTPDEISSAGEPELAIEFSPLMLAYLDDLVACGLYGSTREEVCRYMLIGGLDDLVRSAVILLHTAEGARTPNPAGFAAALAGGLKHWPADGRPDDYYYAKGQTGWAVRGPDGFNFEPPNLDKNAAFALAKFLSDKPADAIALLRGLAALPRSPQGDTLA